MLFNSAAFLFYFLPAVTIGYAICAHFGRKPVVVFLGLMSLVFYAVWRPPFVLLLIGSIVFNYFCSVLIALAADRPRMKRFWMWAAIATNLGALAYFKYFFPFLQFLHYHHIIQPLFDNVILPLGISFFTFTQISYLVDLAQGQADPQDFISYVLFVTFYPHLIAGPILHHREIMPQFAEGRTFRLNWDDVALGLTWFILGLSKKVVIADRIAPIADDLFARPHGLTMFDAWPGVLVYAMQLYFDFSGYSDMAMGLARMVSIKLPFNFNSPYKAIDIVEFWQRWHMTLTRYITLYLYNPMAMAVSTRRLRAGKKVSKKASRTVGGFSSMVALPTIVTMTLAGVWHGAGIHFILFGTLHGIYLTINHLWRTFRKEGTLLARIIDIKPICIAITFIAVCVAQVMFRANSTHEAFSIIRAMFGFNGVGLPGVLSARLSRVSPALFQNFIFMARAHGVSSKSAILVLLLPIVWFMPNTQQILGQGGPAEQARAGYLYKHHWQPNLPWAMAIAACLIWVFYYIDSTSSFLYFQF